VTWKRGNWTEEVVEGQTTTSGTIQLWTFDLSSLSGPTTMLVAATVVAAETSGPSAGERAYYHEYRRFLRDSTPTYSAGTTGGALSFETSAGLDLVIHLSSSTIQLNAVGLASTTIDWVGYVRYLLV
jgi:hypothetical protein